MKALHTLNPLHAGAEALAAVGETQGVLRTTGVSPCTSQKSLNIEIIDFLA
jgi:hypothetical protein